MPLRSLKQARYMSLIAHSPEKARKKGPSVAVAKEFVDADARSGKLSKAMKSKTHGS